MKKFQDLVIKPLQKELLNIKNHLWFRRVIEVARKVDSVGPWISITLLVLPEDPRLKIIGAILFSRYILDPAIGGVADVIKSRRLSKSNS